MQPILISKIKLNSRTMNTNAIYIGDNKSVIDALTKHLNLTVSIQPLDAVKEANDFDLIIYQEKDIENDLSIIKSLKENLQK